MNLQSDSSYHPQFEQTAFNRQTGKHSMNFSMICHSKILNNEVISEWRGNIEKNLSIEYGFSSGTRIHLMIYLPESRIRMITLGFYSSFKTQAYSKQFS